MKRLILLALVLMLFSACASNAGEFRTVYGHGTNSCANWLSSKKDGTYYPMTQWMLGYISAYEKMGSKVLKKTNADGMETWMNDYCKQNPLEQFHNAVDALIKDLQEK